MKTSIPTCVGFGAVLLLGIVFFTHDQRPLSASERVIAALPTNNLELAGVSGLQEVGAEVVLEDGKCCTAGEACSPTAPIVEGGVACTKASSGGCIDAHEDKPCFAWVGNPVKNGKCVTPPAGFEGPARCGMDPRDFQCQKFRTGVCDSTGIFGYGDCVCDVNSAEVWALGQKRCAQGSTPCLAAAVVH